MSVVKGRRRGVPVSIAVGGTVGIPVTPVGIAVAALAMLVVTAPVPVPVGILVLVIVRIIGGAEPDEFPHIGLLDDCLTAVLQGEFGYGIRPRAHGPGADGTTVGDHPDHLIRAVGRSLLIKLDPVHHPEGSPEPRWTPVPEVCMKVVVEQALNPRRSTGTRRSAGESFIKALDARFSDFVQCESVAS